MCIRDSQLSIHYQEVLKNRLLTKKFDDLKRIDFEDMSVRLYNILKFNFQDKRILDIKKEEFLKARNAGITMWNELCDLTNRPNLK